MLNLMFPIPDCLQDDLFWQVSSCKVQTGSNLFVTVCLSPGDQGPSSGNSSGVCVLPVLSGDVMLHVFAKDAQQHATAGAVWRMLLDWSATTRGKQDHDLKAEQCCSFLERLRRCSLPEVTRAADRFEPKLVKLVQAWASRVWKQAGPDEVVAELSSVKVLPSGLHPVLNLVRHASFISELALPGAPTGEHNPLLKLIKNRLTILSLDVDMLEFFFPEEDVKKVNDYHQAVSKNMQMALKGLKEDCGGMDAIVTKYRRFVFALPSV